MGRTTTTKKKGTTTKRTAKSPINSNSAAAKKIIREEIRGFYSPTMYGGGRSALDNMQADADAYNGGRLWGRGIKPSTYTKGAALVDAGSFACYYDDQRKLLRKIYGDRVDDWSGDKVHNTYKHLIGREYAAMLSEREKAKMRKREEQARKKAQRAAKKKNSK